MAGYILTLKPEYIIAGYQMGNPFYATKATANAEKINEALYKAKLAAGEMPKEISYHIGKGYIKDFIRYEEWRKFNPPKFSYVLQEIATTRTPEKEQSNA